MCRWSPGLTETADPVVFESDQGRVGCAHQAEGRVGGAEISSFYSQTLPALGWKPVGGETGVFERESERLTLRVREPAENAPVRVEFELVGEARPLRACPGKLPVQPLPNSMPRMRA